MNIYNPRFYLDQINPLRGLKLSDVIALLELGQRGYYARLQWLYYFVEKRNPMVRAVKRRLLASLSGIDWNIKQADIDQDDQEKKTLAEKQAKALRSAYDAIENLRSALTFLALADLRGFSHVEKIYAGEGDDPWLVKELRIVEQWFWCRQGFYGDWLYNRDARETIDGEAIDPGNYVIHEIDDPADEIFAQLALKHTVSDADWDGFLEDYGIPPMFIVLPPNVPRDRETEFQRAAELALSAARGSLPNGSELTSPSATGSGGTGVFAERLKYIDEQIVIAGTAGKLTVLSEAGSGTLAGSAQKEAFDEIAQAILNQVATRLNEQFDKPLLARLYPNEPVLAYFEFAQINVKDTGAVFDDAVKATEAGYKIEPEELSEKTGYDLTYVGVQGKPGAGSGEPGGGGQSEEPGAGSVEKPAPGSAAPVTATTPSSALPAPSSIAPDPEQLNSLLAATYAQMLEAEAADIEPLRRAIENAIANPTPEKLNELLTQLPELQARLGIHAADVRAKGLGPALVTGLTT
jgi:hypothetical protein